MHILIVDADPWHLQYLKKLVSRFEGCQPVAFATVRKALDWCAANRPELVLADCMIPGLEGLGLVRSLRADPSLADVPILMVTPPEVTQVRRRVLDLGASDVIVLPVDPPELYARMGNLLALAGCRKLLKQDQAADQLVLHLSRMAELRDHETGTHIGHMARYARLIAAKLGWDEAAQKGILLAAPMHDIGKVVIPDHILTKPGRLTDDEYAVMQGHAQLGYEILKDSGHPGIQLATEIALTHHERVGGSGYPNHLRGNDIPLSARIVAVADVFDALTSSRPYKKAWTEQRAQAFLIEHRGTHFDPACVDAFLSDPAEISAIHEGFAEA